MRDLGISQLNMQKLRPVDSLARRHLREGYINTG